MWLSLAGRRACLGLFAWSASLLATPTANASSSADELVREAHVHESAHEDEIALRRYADALALDPSCIDAYIGLGELRVRLGDSREAERVYSVALSHVPNDPRAVVARARARWTLGKRREAEDELRGYAFGADDPRALHELAGWYGEDGQTLPQLTTWRRILWLARRADDAGGATEARKMVRALQVLAGLCDPVTSPPDPNPIRLTLARIARRGG